MAPIAFTHVRIAYIRDLSNDQKYQGTVKNIISEIKKSGEYDLHVQRQQLFILLVRLLLAMTPVLNKKSKIISWNDIQAYDLYKRIYYVIIELSSITTDKEISNRLWKKYVRKIYGDDFFTKYNRFVYDNIDRNCKITEKLLDDYDDNCYQFTAMNKENNVPYLLATIKLLIIEIQKQHGQIIETNC